MLKLIIKLTNIWFEPQLGYRSVKTNPILFCLVMSHTLGCDHIEIKSCSCSELLTSTDSVGHSTEVCELLIPE